jgi:predicted fused transcriptional regulator/phosphomethylpyrimidine kinase
MDASRKQRAHLLKRSAAASVASAPDVLVDFGDNGMEISIELGDSWR